MLEIVGGITGPACGSIGATALAGVSGAVGTLLPGDL